MTGGIAQAVYGTIPEPIQQDVLQRLDPHRTQILNQFTTTCPTL